MIVLLSANKHSSKLNNLWLSVPTCRSIPQMKFPDLSLFQMEHDGVGLCSKKVNGNGIQVF